MERKLVSIQKVLSVEKHPNADKLDIVQVQGWNCIVQRDSFKVNDLCIYFEIDSLLPEDNLFFQSLTFLAKAKYRIKTLRLRGNLSQGLCLPIFELPRCLSAEHIPTASSILIEEGTDLTSIFNVKKYEIPDRGCYGFKGQQVRDTFPFFIPKTDQPRLQSYVKVLDEIVDLKPTDLHVTEKYDGTSFTCFYVNKNTGKYQSGHFGICSRNFELLPEELEANEALVGHHFSKGVYSEIVRKYNLQKKLEGYCLLMNKSLAIQGELCGPGIQKNRLKLEALELFVFDIFDIEAGVYLDASELISTAKYLGLIVASEVKLETKPKTIEEWLQLAKGNHQGLEYLKEGIVVQPSLTTRSKILGQRLTFKVINNDYLEKYGE